MAIASDVKTLGSNEISLILDGLELRIAQLKRSIASESDPAVVELRKAKLELCKSLGFTLAGQAVINY